MKLRKATHKVAELLYSLPGTKGTRCSGAVVVAAGSGTRMGGVAKHFIPLAGFPAIYYSLKAFEDCVSVNETVVVTRECDIERMREIIKEYGFKKVKDVTAGGATRAESARRGFEALSSRVMYVGVHDAARPLITAGAVDALYREAYRYGAVCAVGAPVDTVKRVTPLGFISETIPRDELRSAQTPQVFASDIYLTALSVNEKTGLQVTDDCSMVESAGFRVKACDVGIPNIKLTVPDDVCMAEAVLLKRGEAPCVSQ